MNNTHIARLTALVCLVGATLFFLNLHAIDVLSEAQKELLGWHPIVPPILRGAFSAVAVCASVATLTAGRAGTFWRDALSIAFCGVLALALLLALFGSFYFVILLIQQYAMQMRAVMYCGC